MFDDDAEEYFAEDLANYQATKAHFQATGELKPPRYPKPAHFIDQLGGAIWFANWTNCTRPPPTICAWKTWTMKTTPTATSSSATTATPSSKPPLFPPITTTAKARTGLSCSTNPKAALR